MDKQIVIFGAGRSAFNLIKYLANRAVELSFKISVADIQNGLSDLIDAYPFIEFTAADCSDQSVRQSFIENADLVISMLPVRFHCEVAKDCLEMEKNLLTASYVTEEMQALDEDVCRKGLLFLNEMGLDPGIDHMSALKILDELRSKGYEIKAFESFTGGLLAPESEGSNPWQYKFTWNPRNVVMAGAGGAVKFIDHGMYKYIPYYQLFRRTEIIELPGYGKFEGYANRDSLKYRSLYGLQDVETMFRGTFRRPGFCKAWNVFVQLGLTDDSYELENLDQMTNRSFLNTFLRYHPTDSVETKLLHYLKLDHDDVEIMEKIKWLGLFDETPIQIKKGSPAQILQNILECKWSLKEEDRDMIVMWHKFIYMEGETEKEIHSSMVVKGQSQLDTAMSKTVGLPMGIAAEMILTGRYQAIGVRRPFDPELYLPVLQTLSEQGIEFNELEVR